MLQVSKRSKRLFAFLVGFMMIVSQSSYLSLNKVYAETNDSASTETVYMLTNTLKAGQDYIVASGDSGSVSVLERDSNSISSAKTEVTSDENGTFIKAPSDDVVWTAVKGDKSSSLLTNGDYAVGLDENGDLALSKDSEETSLWSYDGGKQLLAASGGDSPTYMVFGKDFEASNDGDEVYLYVEAEIETGTDEDANSERGPPEATEEDSEAIEEDTPTDNDSEATEEPAAKATEPATKGVKAASNRATLLAFTSDVHNKGQNTSNNSADRLGTWIDMVNSNYGSIDYMGFGGDMGNASTSASNFWSLTGEVMGVVNGKITEGKLGGVCYTTGNHEYSPGDFNNTTNDQTAQYTLNAEVKNGSNYRIYCLGSGSGSQSYSSSQITALSTYLKGVNNKKPIFIITHFPLHVNGSRSTTNAEDVIETLNSAVENGTPNDTSDDRTIVFLWGHNHSQGDTTYDEIFGPGLTHDSITYSGSNSKDIKFYYGAAGCMSDSEYTGSSSVKGKGLLASITNNRSSSYDLELTYLDASGNDKTENDGGVTVNVTAKSTIDFVQTDTLEDGKEYLIANGNTGEVYVVSNESTGSGDSAGLVGITASVSDGKITLSEEDAAKAVFTTELKTSDSGSISAWIKNGDNYLYTASSNGLRISNEQTSSGNTGKFWHYNATDKLLWYFKDTSSTDGYDDASNTYKYWLEYSGTDSVTFTANHTTATTGQKSMSAFDIPGMYLFVQDDGSDPIAVTGISLDKETASVEVGKTINLIATFEPSNATNKTLTWTSSDETVATVNNGTVTGVAEGDATITVTTEDGGFTDTCVVSVTPNTTPRYVLTDNLEGGGEYLIVSANSGSAYALKNPGTSGTNIANANYKTSVAIQSGAPSYIETDNTDIVWTATASGSGFHLTNGGLYLEGKSGNTGVYSALNNSDRSWTYSDTNQLQMPGSTNYTYTLRYNSSSNYFQGSSSTSSNTYKVYLFKKVDTTPVAVTEITLDKQTADVAVNGELQLNATVTPANASNKGIIWSSNNEAVATVDQNGKVTGIAEGTAVITATSAADETISASCTVTVSTVHVESVTLDKTNAEVMESKTLQLTATVLPENASDKTVTWTSSDPAIASVDDAGIVTGVAAGGPVTITATSGGKSATCEVTVTEYVAPTGYVITIDGYALSTADFDGYLLNSSTYYYYGLIGVQYDSSQAASEDILWTITEHGDGYYIQSQDGRYLNATYGTVGSNTEGRVKLDNTPDVWKLEGSLDDWKVDGSTLLSSNANKSLTCETGTTGTSPRIFFTVRSTGETSTLVDPEHPITTETVYVETDTLTTGKNYIVAVANNDTSVYALKNSSGSVVSQELSVTPTNGSDNAYISTEDTGVVWKYTSSSSNYYFINNSTNYLRYDRNDSYKLKTTTSSSSATSTTYSNNHLKMSSRYVQKDGDSFKADSSESNASTIRLFVEKKIIAGPSLTLDKQTMTVPVDSTGTLTATVKNAEGATVTWTSSDEAIATVNNGIVSGVSAGTATITASMTYEGETYTATCTVTVKEVATLTYDYVAESEVGKAYVIVSNGYALVNDNGAVAAVPATVEGNTVTILAEEYDEADMLWTVDEPDNGTFKNGNYYVRRASGSSELAVTLNTEPSTKYTNWSYDGEKVTVIGGNSSNTTYYLYYSDGWKTSTTNNGSTKLYGVQTTHTHTMTHHAAVPATCTEDGTVEYWSCAVCEKNFSDEAGTTELESIVVPAAGHDMTHHAAVPATCTEDGTVEYWSCSVCGKNFSNEAGTDELTSIVAPAAGHQMTHHAAVAPTCTEAGTVEYWSCSLCEKNFSDETGTTELESIVDSATGHNWDNPVWAWAEDYSTASATFKCKTDATHTETVDATITDAVGTGENEGYTVYTATVTHNNETFTDTKRKVNQYTFVFLANAGDTEAYSTITANYGEQITPPADPTKAFYTFNGWNAEIPETMPAENKTFTAQWTAKDTYYVVGTMNNWTISEAYELTQSSDGEYSGSVSLAANDQIKVVRAVGGEKVNADHYPSNEHPGYNGTTDNYTVDANHAGNVTLYFRPAGNFNDAGWQNFGGYFYIEGENDITVVVASGDTTGTAQAVRQDASGAAATSAPKGMSITVENTPANGYQLDTIELYKTSDDSLVEALTGNTFTMPDYNVTVKVSFKKITWTFVDFTWTGSDETGYTAAVANFDGSDGNARTVDATVSSNTTDPTCETAGETVYTAAVTTADSLDGEEHSDSKTVTIPATGHDWDTPTYEWAADNSKVTATRVCKNDENHVQTETVNATSEVTKAATCEEAGVMTYTSEAFENTAFTVQTTTAEIPATGHDWGAPTYEWAEDYGSVTATRVCGNDAMHKETETVSATSEVTTPATCEGTGVRTYTSAAFENTAFTVQTTIAEIPATDHDWGAPTYEWAEDYGSVTATRVCGNDSAHKQTETASATSEVTTPATCEGVGVRTYTSAAFENTAFTVQTTTAEIPATGHDWDAPTYEWAADNSKVTATRVCKNDATHKETQTVDTTSDVTTPATCEAKGKTTYTATFTNAAFAVQTKTVENIDALGHAWGAPTWSWVGNDDDGYTEATATFVCGNDPAHTQNVTAETIDVQTDQPGPETAGSVTYTATVTGPDEKTYTDKKIKTLDPAGYTYKNPEYSWDGTDEEGYTVTALRECIEDPTKNMTEEVTAVYAVVEAATCEAAGTGRYTATFENTVFEPQTKNVTIAALGHDWEFVDFTWAEDYSTATANYKCDRDSSHTKTLNVTADVENTPATCEAAGSTLYTVTVAAEASFDNKEHTADKTIQGSPATGHAYGAATYEWAEDNSIVTATRICANDATHVETETVNTTSKATDPTCTEAGYTTYTATFENTAFAVQTKKVDGDPASGHKYGEPTYVWAEDNTACTATAVCSVCEEGTEGHSVTEEAAVSYAVTTAATCTTVGSGTYTATFTNELFTKQTKDVEISATGHTMTHHEAVPATCTADGTVEYWSCPVCEKNFSDEAGTTELTNIVDPATGHNWRAEWTWAEDYSAATVTFICENDSSHQEAGGEVLVTSEEGTGDDVGKTIHTAAVQFNGKTYTDVKIVGVVNTVTFNSNGGTAIDPQDVAYGAKATKPEDPKKDKCDTFDGWFSNEALTTEFDFDTPITADITLYAKWTTNHKIVEDEAVAPTCTETGLTSGSHCSVCGTVIVSQQIVPATGHDWGEPAYEWAEDYSTVTATAVCTKDESHVITETVESTSEVTKEPTTEEPGERTYTATFTNEPFTVQTVIEEIPVLENDDVLRISGETRYKTSMRIADYYMDKINDGAKFRSVVIATGTNFPDALAGSYFANQNDAPIIMIDESSASEVVSYVNNNLAGNGTVYVLGGEGAVPEAWIDDLEKGAKRLSGDTRYDTNIKILKKADVEGGDIFVCTGTGFADALSGSGLDMPILLVGSGLTDSQKAFLENGDGWRFHVIGGTLAVDEATAAELRSYGTVVRRIAGDDRYDTSERLAKRYAGNASQMVLATGKNFPDGLCGGPVAYNLGAPIILTDPGSSAHGENYADTHSIKSGIVLGGTLAIDDPTVRKVFQMDADDEIILY